MADSDLTGAGGRAASEIPGKTVSRARDGDADAFQMIFKRYAKPVLSFIYSLTGDRLQAEDLTQETFVRAYSRIATLRHHKYLSTWLFGIARNVAREALRRRYAARESLNLEQVEEQTLPRASADPETPLLAGELGREIRGALSALSEDGRVVFVLKVIHRMNYDDISRVTGHSVGKLKTDLHRARLQMRERLTRYLGDAETEVRGVS